MTGMAPTWFPCRARSLRTSTSRSRSLRPASFTSSEGIGPIPRVTTSVPSALAKVNADLTASTRASRSRRSANPRRVGKLVAARVSPSSSRCLRRWRMEVEENSDGVIPSPTTVRLPA